MNKINSIHLQNDTFKIKVYDSRIFKFGKQKYSYEHKNYKDFTIDGSSVIKQILNAEPNAPVGVTMLADGIYNVYKVAYLKKLLGEEPTDLLSGRASIYFCPIDLDNNCGVAACYIDFDDEYVTWRDFRWDGDDGTDNTEYEIDEEYAAVEGLGEYTFERKAYEQFLKEELNNYLP